MHNDSSYQSDGSHLAAPRSEEVVRLRFTPQEKAHYERIEEITAEILETEMDELEPSTSCWLTALQQIHSLRLVCNLGVCGALGKLAPELSTFSAGNDTLQLLNARLMMGDPSCQHCSMIFDLPQAASHFDVHEPAYYSNCYKFFCATCATIFKFNAPKPCDCGTPNAACTLQPIPLQHLAPALSPMRKSMSPSPGAQSRPYMSTKVCALMSDISRHLDKKR